LTNLTANFLYLHNLIDTSYVLRKLKDDYGVLAIKAEFEAEGFRLDELIMLNEVVFRADMDLIIKIGGCEAVRDLDQCKLLGTHGIMASMIETPFAMEKYINQSQASRNNERVIFMTKNIFV